MSPEEKKERLHTEGWHDVEAYVLKTRSYPNQTTHSYTVAENVGIAKDWAVVEIYGGQDDWWHMSVVDPVGVQPGDKVVVRYRLGKHGDYRAKEGHVVRKVQIDK